MIDIAVINRARVQSRARSFPRWVVRSCTGIALVLGSARVAGAQGCTAGPGAKDSCTATFPITMTVIKMTRLEIVPSSLTLLASGDATVLDYEAGFKTAGSLALTAYTNNGAPSTTPGASVTMAAATTNFSYSGTASPTPTKAASTLQYSVNAGGSWINTTTAGGTVLTAPGATAGTNQTVLFRTGLSWTADPPGTYTLTLNFTITAP